MFDQLTSSNGWKKCFGSSDSFREDAVDSKIGTGDRERPDVSEHGPIDRTTMPWPSCTVNRFLRFAETLSGCISKGSTCSF